MPIASSIADMYTHPIYIACYYCLYLLLFKKRVFIQGPMEDRLYRWMGYPV